MASSIIYEGNVGLWTNMFTLALEWKSPKLPSKDREQGIASNTGNAQQFYQGLYHMLWDAYQGYDEPEPSLTSLACIKMLLRLRLRTHASNASPVEPILHKLISLFKQTCGDGTARGFM